MSHLTCRVESFEIIAPNTPRIDFHDSTRQVIDFQPVLHGRRYGRLRDLALFNKIKLDTEVHTVVWPNGRTLILRRFTNRRVARPPVHKWRAWASLTAWYQGANL
jgi:hypothetical protein